MVIFYRLPKRRQLLPHWERKNSSSTTTTNDSDSMNNRLSEISDWITVEIDNDLVSDEKDDIEMCPVQGNQKEEGTNIIVHKNPFKVAEVIKSDLTFIHSITTKILEMNENAILSTSTTEQEIATERLKPSLDAAYERAQRIKTLLTHLQNDTKTLVSQKKIRVSDLRIRDNIFNTLSKKFIKVMKDYQNAQEKHKTDMIQKEKRKIQTINPQASAKDVQDMLKQSHDTWENLVKDQILNCNGYTSHNNTNEGTKKTNKTSSDSTFRRSHCAVLAVEPPQKKGVSEVLSTTYDHALARNEDIVALEQSVVQLRLMFLDLALLTEQQGDILDRIDFHVQQADDYVSDGNEDVRKSIDFQDRIRRKKCCLINYVALMTIFSLLFLGIRKSFV